MGRRAVPVACVHAHAARGGAPAGTHRDVLGHAQRVGPRRAARESHIRRARPRAGGRAPAGECEDICDEVHVAQSVRALFSSSAMMRSSRGAGRRRRMPWRSTRAGRKRGRLPAVQAPPPHRESRSPELDAHAAKGARDALSGIPERVLPWCIEFAHHKVGERLLPSPSLLKCTPKSEATML